MIKTASILLTFGLALAIWWFGFESRAPALADNAIPLSALRQQILADKPEQLPRRIELYRVGSGKAPMFAVQAGEGLGDFTMAYTAFGIRYAKGSVMIDAAADRETAMAIGDKDTAHFDDAAYRLLLERIAIADQVVLTHEHKDHIMAIVRNPALASFASRLRMTESQRRELLIHAHPDHLRQILMRLPATRITRPTRLAPGIAAAPAAGHSPGSLVILVRLSGGREYLFIGDIAWAIDNIMSLKTRPRFLQWFMFDPNEDRETVLAQLRALHDIHQSEPELVLVPSHDKLWLDGLLAKGLIQTAVPGSVAQPDNGKGPAP